MFAKEAWRIAGEVGDLAFAIHHIGSTSIAGIYAKPVIDILLEASTGEALDGLGARMAHVGYQGLGEFGISGRRYFRKDDSLGTRTHQVHAFLKGDVHVHRHLAFRDYLCAHEGVAQAYSTLKRELADHCHDGCIHGRESSVHPRAPREGDAVVGAPLGAKRSHTGPESRGVDGLATLPLDQRRHAPRAESVGVAYGLK